MRAIPKLLSISMTPALLCATLFAFLPTQEAHADSTRYGQSGVRNTQRATVRKDMFHLGVNARGTYYNDFINEAIDDKDIFLAGNLWGSLAFFELIELSLATQGGSNTNNTDRPQTRNSIGDFYSSAKFGLTLRPVAFGVDLRLALPTLEQSAGLNIEELGVTATGMFTLDFGEGVPFRAHINGGYVYQNNKAQKDILRAGLAGHYLNLANDKWFYDHVLYSVALEFPLGVVTPYVDVFGQYAFTNPGGGPNGADYAITDSALTVSPGIKAHPIGGLTIDLGVDVGALGSAGYLEPQESSAVPGQPIVPLWAAYLGLSYSFSAGSSAPKQEPATGATKATSETPGATRGTVAGCVKDSEGNAIKNAVIDTGVSGVSKLLTGDDGCFSSYLIDSGKRNISVSHPRFATATKEVEIGEKESVQNFVLENNAAMARFSGKVSDTKKQDAKVQLVITRDDQEVMSESVEGAFDVELPAGNYQILLQSDAYLAQGAVIELEPEQTLTRDFVVKPVPKKRLSTVEKGKINLAIKIPFESGKATLLKAAEFVLDEVVDRILAGDSIKKVRIEGHTDNQGDPAYNKELSKKRAKAVFDYLVEKGVPKTRLESEGFGSSRPIAKNKSEAGRAKNRRVDFVIVGAE